jgi:hypothetical protein
MCRAHFALCMDVHFTGGIYGGSCACEICPGRSLVSGGTCVCARLVEVHLFDHMPMELVVADGILRSVAVRAVGLEQVSGKQMLAP